MPKKPSVFTETLYVYVQKPQLSYVKEEARKANCTVSSYMDGLIAHVRKSKRKYEHAGPKKRSNPSN